MQRLAVERGAPVGQGHDANLLLSGRRYRRGQAAATKERGDGHPTICSELLPMPAAEIEAAVIDLRGILQRSLPGWSTKITGADGRRAA